MFSSHNFGDTVEMTPFWSFIYQKILHGPRPKPHVKVACKPPIYKCKLPIYSKLVVYKCKLVVYMCKPLIYTYNSPRPKLHLNFGCELAIYRYDLQEKIGDLQQCKLAIYNSVKWQFTTVKLWYTTA